MPRSIWIALALLCIVCLLALLIAPLVDPPVTRLPSDSSQLLMLCWLIVVACALFLNLARLFSAVSLSRLAAPLRASHVTRHPLTMSRALRH
jgi:hypothetical protein